MTEVEGGSRPRLTIYIPTYNRAGHLRPALERIVDQLEPLQGRVELVVSDNCSEDGTSALLDSFAHAHPWIRALRTPEHFPTAEQNIAFLLHHCRGEYLWGLGDDDHVAAGGVADVLDWLDQEPAEFHLLNSAVFYADTGQTRRAFIPMAGGVKRCTIQEITARVGLSTILASLSSVVLRTDRLKAVDWNLYVGASPIYAHVAAYLDAFDGATCILGAPSPVTIREAATAPVTFSALAQRTGARMWAPFSVGLTRLLALLIRSGKISPDFPPRIVEQNHHGRRRLLYWMVAQHYVQLELWLTKGRTIDALTVEEVDELSFVAAWADLVLQEQVLRLRRVVVALSVLHGSESGNEAPEPLDQALTIMGPAGVKLRDSVHDWARAEQAAGIQILRDRLPFRSSTEIVEQWSGYVIVQRGWDWLALKENGLDRLPVRFDSEVVDPVDTPPYVLVEDSLEALRRRLQRLGSPPADIETRSADEIGKSLRDVIERASTFFDADWYASQPSPKARLAAGDTHNPIDDYVRHGANELLNPNPWFNESWYKTRYPEAVAAVASGRALSGFHHYMVEGRFRHDDPGPRFAEAPYLHRYPDVAEAVKEGTFFCNGLEHWIRHGVHEGRQREAPRVALTNRSIELTGP